MQLLNLTRKSLLCAIAALAASQLSAQPPSRPAARQNPLLLTITNGPVNYLAVIDTHTKQLNYVPTNGVGGASGNAGSVAANGKLAAAVNFNSSNVTIFTRRANSMDPIQVIATASKPVSVAFGHDHLVVLGLTTAESFPLMGDRVSESADGMAPLLRADGSAAQIVTYDGGAVYSEKSGSVATLAFGIPGINGPSVSVPLAAAPNNDTPFGMVARGPNVYVTIAHSNMVSLVSNGKIISTAGGPTPFKDAAGAFLHAPCWNALYGQFLYSADSPGKQLLRYLVSDRNIFYDAEKAATFAGPPTDLDVRGKLLGVIDGGDGKVSNASIFDIDAEGGLALRFSVKIASPINGAAIIE